MCTDFRLQGTNINNTTKRALSSRVVLVGAITTMMLFVLVFPSSSSSILSLQQQQAEASSYGLEDRVPPAYIVIDGKASKLQLENSPFQVNDKKRIGRGWKFKR